MTATVLFILRLAVALALYGFILWALYNLFRELRQQGRLISERQAPALTLTWELGEERFSRPYLQSEVTIGRGPTADCQLSHETVSNRHARLSYHHNQWWLEDLHSTNGTFLNEEPLTTATVVISGDRIRCGQVELAVTMDEGRKA